MRRAVLLLAAVVVVGCGSEDVEIPDPQGTEDGYPAVVVESETEGIEVCEAAGDGWPESWGEEGAVTMDAPGEADLICVEP